MAPTLHWIEVVCDKRGALRDNRITDKLTNISKGSSHSRFEKRPPASETQREFELSFGGLFKKRKKKEKSFLLESWFSHESAPQLQIFLL